jgi:hypothetical protein
MNTTQTPSTEVKMMDTRGKLHMVSVVVSRSGQANTCSRKWIASKGKFSGNIGQVDITGWAVVE